VLLVTNKDGWTKLGVVFPPAVTRFVSAVPGGQGSRAGLYRSDC